MECWYRQWYITLGGIPTFFTGSGTFFLRVYVVWSVREGRSGDVKHVVLCVQLIMQSGYGKSIGRNATLPLNGDLERLTHSPVVLLGQVSVEPPEIY